MASGSSAIDADHGNQVSAAQKLQQMHNHQPMVEDVPEEDDSVGFENDVSIPAVASSTAGAANGMPAPSWPVATEKKATAEPTAASVPAPATVPVPTPAAKLDTQSHELFPELGGLKKAPVVAPVWTAKTNGTVNGQAAVNGSSAPVAPTLTNGSAPAAAVPPPAIRPPALNIPGRNSTIVSLPDSDFLPRTALKRPIPDIIKDINRKSRANVTMLAPSGGQKHFSITGPPDIADQALRDLVQQIGAKVTATVPIPQSARAYIIGKQGSTIKSIQEKTGARIQVPKADEVTTAADDDDDASINLTIEGNVLSARDARDAIMKIVRERFSNVNTRVRGIPTEFYPFIADPKNGLLSNLESSGVQVRVPPLQPWSSRPPQVSNASGRPVFSPPVNDNHIQLAGERTAVQNARAEIEKLAAELHERLHVQQTSISRGQQQFIIGNNGLPMEDFFNETGCAVVLPKDEDDDLVTIVGPADQVEAGLDRAIELATGMRCSNYDISRIHRQAPGSAALHAQNVTRYLRRRKEIERLEKAYRASINTPYSHDGALPWEIFSRDGKDGIRAQTEIRNIVSGLPPARMAHLPVDPFFHAFLQTDVRPRLQQQYGVYLVVPDATEPNAPVLIVYEGPSSDEPFSVPQSAPSPDELAAFQEAVRGAEKHIRDLIAAQDEITSLVIDVPTKHHDRLKKFIRAEQDKRQPGQPAIRVSNTGSNVTLRGPKSLVEQLAAKVEAFVEQEKQDEKERDFTLSFDFPKVYANHLIGKGGSNIRELRDKFDVEIQVEDGKVELKGPKAKAEAARAHINAVARHLADETTHTLKIEPKFHRELIGAQGGTINRLQKRYKVLIFFPRVAKNLRDDESVTTTSDSGKHRRQQAPDEVIIRGPKKGADEAREEILNLYLYLKETSFNDKVEVQQKQVPYLIGHAGSGMEAIRQQTGAKIDVPNSRGDPESTVEILLKGTKEQVAAAKKILTEKKAILDDTVVKTIEVDKKYHKALIGSGGSQIREIVTKAGGPDDRRELAKAIQFPNHDSSENTIKVEGRRAFVDKVIDIINGFVSERASEVVEVVDVPQDKHKMLIGRNGETRRNIESEFGVTLGIPRLTEKRTDVKVVGKPSNVQQAKEKILGILQSSSATTVDVPRRLHHAVSNGGQFFRRMRSDFHVTVDHNGEAVPSQTTPLGKSSADNKSLPLITDDEDAAAGAHSWRVVELASSETGTIPWVLRGTPENVEKAKKALLKAVEAADQNKVTGYLILPDPSVYRHIVGVQGKKIETIRKESGCRIFVPHSRNGGQEAIEIVGSKDGVETARELILTAVKEGAQR